MERRNFIQASVAAAIGVAWAGCSDDNGGGLGGNGDGNGTGGPNFPSFDLPAYSAWPPDEPRTRDFVLFTHLNAEHLQTGDGEGTPTPSPTPTPEDEDKAPLIWMPFYGFFATALWFYLGMWGYPWQGALGGESEPTGMETEALTMTEGTFVFHGQYDASAFAEEYADGFEEREKNGFTVFEGQEGGDTDEMAYAVSEDAVVVALSPDDVGGHDEVVGNLDDAIGNHIDEAGRVVDDEDGEWLYETTGVADAVTGFWRVDGLEEDDIAFSDEDEEVDEEASDIADNPVFNNVTSFISMLALPGSENGVGGDTTAARFSALYPQGEVPSEDELREELMQGTDSDELEVVTHDDRAHVAAEVNADETGLAEDE